MRKSSNRTNAKKFLSSEFILDSDAEVDEDDVPADTFSVTSDSTILVNSDAAAMAPN